MAAARRVLLIIVSAFAPLAHAGKKTTTATQLRHSGGGDNGADGSFVRRVEFEHHLRICNAYPLTEAVEVSVDGKKRLTGDAPLAYKACRDFTAPLDAGDKLDFKVGETTTGTFSISSLPSSDAVLLLVVHRHDASSTSVAFDSHVFTNLGSAQVAVIDTYKGNIVATPRIQEKAGAKSGNRSEELRYNSVIAVNSGAYNVVLDDQNGTAKAAGELVALNKESYVLMRTGVQAPPGQQSFPEELVVFPHSSPELLHSGALCADASLVSLLAALLVCRIFVG